MAEEKRTVELSDFDLRLLVSALAEYRNLLIRDQRPTRDAEEKDYVLFCEEELEELFNLNGGNNNEKQ